MLGFTGINYLDQEFLVPFFLKTGHDHWWYLSSWIHPNVLLFSPYPILSGLGMRGMHQVPINAKLCPNQFIIHSKCDDKSNLGMWRADLYNNN